MSFNIEVEGGTSVRLPTAGKYCDRDIVVTAIGGGTAPKGLIWTETDVDGYPIKVDATSVIATNNLFRYGDYRRTKEITLPTTKQINTYHMCYENESLEEINLPTEARYLVSNMIDAFCCFKCKSLKLSDWQIPNGVTMIGTSAFEYAEVLTDRIIPSSVITISAKAFNRCYAMQKVIFLGTPTTIGSNSFANCTSLLNIYVPWSEGEVANAPWGATNATIHYNYVWEG